MGAQQQPDWRPTLRRCGTCRSPSATRATSPTDGSATSRCPAPTSCARRARVSLAAPGRPLGFCTPRTPPGMGRRLGASAPAAPACSQHGGQSHHFLGIVCGVLWVASLSQNLSCPVQYPLGCQEVWVCIEANKCGQVKKVLCCGAITARTTSMLRTDKIATAPFFSSRAALFFATGVERQYSK